MAMRIAVLADIHSNLEAFRAVLRHAEAGGEIEVGELAAGDIFGEMAIFMRQPRSATVRARGPARRSSRGRTQPAAIERRDRDSQA